MDYSFTNERPIYLQLMDLFKMRIVSGALSPGCRLDSVRDLAMEAHVNPNTMQKALSELERLGLVRAERTSGRFITDDEEKIAGMRSQLVSEEVSAFMGKMEALGFTKSEVLRTLRALDA